MNAASLAIVAVVLALAALAAWRCLKKGAPCECGGTCRPNGGCGCGCHCDKD